MNASRPVRCGVSRPVRCGVSKGEEDGRRPPAHGQANPRSGRPQGVERSGMAGPGETLGSPWPPLPICQWFKTEDFDEADASFMGHPWGPWPPSFSDICLDPAGSSTLCSVNDKPSAGLTGLAIHWVNVLVVGRRLVGHGQSLRYVTKIGGTWISVTP